MAITYPRTLPLLGAATNLFELDRADWLSREGSGRLGAMAGGFPLWRGEWQIGAGVSRALSDDWRAFVASMAGASRLFYGYDIERPYPKAHPNGFAALSWSGDATSWSQSIGADGQATLTLTGLPAALKIGAGDYVGFRWTTGGAQRRSLVRSLEAVTPSGGSASFGIEPAVPAVTASGATAYLANPTCLMRLDPRETSMSSMDRRRVVGGRVVALQDLLP